MFAKYKKIIIGILIIGLLFIVYSIFFSDEPQAENLLETNSSRELDRLGEDIIRSLSRIQSIELDQSVLSDSIYLRLIDNPVIIPQPQIGRENPFQPLPIQNVNVEVQVDNNE